MLCILGFSAQLLTAVPLDTPPPKPSPRPRAQAIEVGDWYNRRLTIHRWASYASYPLFAFQYAAGREIWDKGTRAPDWARRGHRIGAASIAGVFAANTITGVWNLVESRHVEDGRTRRYLHAASMLLADAGFAWAGAVLTVPDQKKQHRTVALASIGISATSATLMLLLNR
jgi:hypothetical protein